MKLHPKNIDNQRSHDSLDKNSEHRNHESFNQEEILEVDSDEESYDNQNDLFDIIEEETPKWKHNNLVNF